ncbi:Mycobacterium numidiamassiliense ORFan [Mycobacterium numidiamassiliense]|jgi:hypothetical protein|uniref:Mycobacterium numidiamassiliense ORFan n=1 Tax=Mycobacterium numidiamassiliense TaxID=1841861 RepID=A0A2U3PBI4_9MYCO|nr:Mycobacterium numidiamassiliense ORFan [Mycobacterium numidiamassiliense]
MSFMTTQAELLVSAGTGLALIHLAGPSGLLGG